jgi:menaquinone-dependent protoporphyrinogen IX oxidase
MLTSPQHPEARGMPRALVAYASKHGSTAEIAQAITFDLRRAGISVDCLEVAEVSSLDDERAMLRDTPDQFADLRDWDQVRECAHQIAASIEARFAGESTSAR